MKRKLLLVIAMVAVLACFFALAVSADVHSNVDKTTKVILDSGIEVALFDNEGNALIWYLDNSGNLQSIRADDIEDGDNGVRVEYYTETNRGQTALAKVNIYSGGSIIGYNANIVVFNIMDDDIAFDTDPNQEGIQKMTLIMETFNKVNKAPNGAMLLEYAYLRLDTTKIGGRAFGDCTKLKYINIEELTELESLGATDGYNYGGTFRNCSSLFANQVVDLSKTKITTIKEGNPLYGNFAQTPISGIKLPSTVTFIGNHTFYACKNLTTIWLSSNPEIEYNAFVEATALKQIFYSGSKDGFNELLKKLDPSGNTPFLTVVGENNSNLISYSAYKQLPDQNVKCAVYDYNSCDYNGAHEETTEVNACVSLCNNCGATIVKHSVSARLNESIVYTDYTENGTKTVACTNESCTYKATEKAPALFTCLGYSVGPDGYSLKAGFMVNLDAVKEYKEFYPSFTFGVVIVNANTVKSSEAFFVSEVINSSAKGIMVRVDDLQYTILNVDISNFNADMAGTLELVVGLYTNDGEGNMKVAQHVNSKAYTTTKSYSDMKLNAITFNQVRIAHDMEALVPTTPPTTTDEQ